MKSWRRQGFLLVLPLALVLLSCATPPSRPLPDARVIPANDSPENAILRLIALYETKDAEEYGRLFTRDYSSEPPIAVDPSLVHPHRYDNPWFKADEIAAAEHLFEGGTSLDGYYRYPAGKISLKLVQTVPLADTAAGRDPRYYKVLLTTDRLEIESNSCGSDAILSAEQRIALVRGDLAGSLDADQPADSLHWYVYHWAEECPEFSPSSPALLCWSQLKACYR